MRLHSEFTDLQQISPEPLSLGGTLHKKLRRPVEKTIDKSQPVVYNEG